MNLDEFWNLIDKVNAETVQNDKKTLAEAIKKALMEYTPEAIKDWVLIKTEYHKLAVYNKALWEECAKLGLDDADDGFYYFTPWLIAQGREIYCTVMNDPKTLSNYVQPGDDAEFELFNHISHEAYSERVIKDTFTEKELENLYEKWCADNTDRIERYAYQANVDMTTGSRALFQSYMHGKYNLFKMAEEQPLSDTMKQDIRESLTKKHLALSEKIYSAESNRTETVGEIKETELER